MKFPSKASGDQVRAGAASWWKVLRWRLEGLEDDCSFSKEMDSSLGTENITADLNYFGIREKEKRSFNLLSQIQNREDW